MPLGRSIEVYNHIVHILSPGAAEHGLREWTLEISRGGN
jgi:hypothetical protein